MTDLQSVYDLRGLTKLKRMGNPFGILHYIMSDFLRRNVTFRSGDKVLDAGCGYGLISKAVHEEAFSLDIKIDQYAFDLSESMPDAFRDYVQAPVNIECANARDLNYKDHSFDTIICSGMFEHIENPLEVLSEFRRCLKKDGQLVLIISQKFPVVRLANYFLFGKAGTYRYSEFCPYVEQAGFNHIERRYFSLKFFLMNIALFAISANA